jgi:hypothetical protein
VRALYLLLSLAATLCAQDNYEIQVYPSETLEAQRTMVELHSNFTVNGSRHTIDGVRPTNHAEHETIEITHGFNAWFETGFYIFTSARSGDGLDWVGDHIRPRIRAPATWNWPVGVSLSTEFGYVRPAFSTGAWTIEIRPIVDQKVGPWYWAFNPAFDRAFKGPDARTGWGFSPNFKFSYDLNPKISADSSITARSVPLPASIRFGTNSSRSFRQSTSTSRRIGSSTLGWGSGLPARRTICWSR